MKPNMIRGAFLIGFAMVFAMLPAPALAEEGKDVTPSVICGGCISPAFTSQGKGSVTPYARIELDVIYSNRNTNPLDPSQFNGYATAAGKSSNASSTFNPRYSVFGIRGDRTDGAHVLKGVIEADFYGQTDNSGNIPPRLRLAYAMYSPNNNKTSITVGQDWTPVMGLHPNLIDFSIMGYNGNLWQRLPQITVRQKLNDNFDVLFTVMKFERGLDSCCGAIQVRPNPNGTTAGGGPTNQVAFNDPSQSPYFGTRLAYTSAGGTMVAVNAAYRYYRSAPTLAGAVPAGRDINSYLLGAELAYPITNRLKFMGEIAYGQALGLEFFRFNQDRNLGTGAPIRTVVGWGELNYAYDRDYTFVAGYGFDNPLNSDLRGTTAGIDTQYVLNHRTYLTVVRHWWGDFYTGWEWNHLMTEWSTLADKHQGDNFMMSMWYNF